MAARPHHYEFAHRTLPGQFFFDVEQFNRFSKMDGKVFLHYLWTNTAEDLEDGETLDYELEFERRKHEGFDLILITLPAPVEITEAYYALLASDGRKHFYYTLELGKSLNGKELAVHCEWTADGTHKNYGNLTNNDKENFVRACTKRFS